MTPEWATVGLTGLGLIIATMGHAISHALADNRRFAKRDAELKEVQRRLAKLDGIEPPANGDE